MTTITQETTPSPLTPPQEKAHEDNIVCAVVCGCIAMFLLAIMQVCGKMLADNHNVIEIAFYRNLVAVIPLAIYVFAARKTRYLVTKKPIALFFRVLVGFTGLIATFAAFAWLPMSEATVILMTSVLISPALAFFILKEHIGPHRWAAIVIGLFGVVLMVGPAGDFRSWGVIVAFVAALFQAGIQVFLRHLKTESSFTVTFYFILGGAILGGFFMPFIAVTPTPHEWLLLIGVGISGGLAQYFLTTAFRSGPAAVVSPLNYTGLIWASLFDIFIWKHIPGFPVFAGAAIIIFSQAYILHRERLKKKKR